MKKDSTILDNLGWQVYSQNLPEVTTLDLDQVARITIENRNSYTLQSTQGELEGFVRGKTIFKKTKSSDFPKVGDWVEIEKLPNEKRAVITNILPRKSKIARKEKHGSLEEQVIVANINLVFIVQGLDGDFSPQRLERYLSIIEDGGSSSVIVLNKVDLVDDVTSYLAEIALVAKGVPVVAISAENKTGFEELLKHIKPQDTIAFIGSSGVGKSTIINHLLGKEIQDTKTVRENDSRGRHTTTRRELFLLENGGIVIDTPGIREVGVGMISSPQASFADIKELISKCKFNKCDHEKTEGCAVKAALESGELDKARYMRFLKLQKEHSSEQFKKSLRSQEGKYRRKNVSKEIRRSKKHKHRRFDF